MKGWMLIQVKSIAEWSILKYFRPALSENIFLGHPLSGRFSQVLLLI